MPADLAVIGLGHLGLPLAQAATAAGIRTIGFDPDEHTVTELRAGRPPVEGALTAADIRRMLSGGFGATTDPAVLGRAHTAVICVPTPLGKDGAALDLTAVRDAARALAARLRPRTTVILESTVYPGSTEGILRPLLERGSGLRAGRDFHLACSPGRLDPGSRKYGYANTPKVIGGLTPACTEAAAAFYSRLTERVVRARGPREAETVKVLEINFRHVNIALVNEMAVLCHDLGVDVWDVVRCAETKPFGFHAFRPGPGVGGHGVPIAADYLTCHDGGGGLDCPPPRLKGVGGGPPGEARWGSPRRSEGVPPAKPGGESAPSRMTELAREVNAWMPRYVCRRAAALLNEHGKSARGARVLLAGVTYKPDLADQEGSPAREIATELGELGAELSYHDPYVPRWRVAGRPVPRAESLYESAAAADLTVLLQHHRTYDLQGLAAKAQLLFDTRGASPAGAAHRL